MSEHSHCGIDRERTWNSEGFCKALRAPLRRLCHPARFASKTHIEGREEGASLRDEPQLKELNDLLRQIQRSKQLKSRLTLDRPPAHGYHGSVITTSGLHPP